LELALSFEEARAELLYLPPGIAEALLKRRIVVPKSVNLGPQPPHLVVVVSHRPVEIWMPHH
jgi:hypothetical protein